MLLFCCREESIANKRLQNVLKEGNLPISSCRINYFVTRHAIRHVVVRRLVLLKRDSDGVSKNSELLGQRVHICSENNFPTAAGLASSAAGYACLG